MASKNYATMPIKQQLGSTRDHLSFTSVSSNESATNTNLDAAPLRIQSMPLLSEDYFKQRQASGETLLANKTPTQSSRLFHYENTTRRMRSVSLPIDQFTKNNGQVDGRYLPKDSKNYSNPHLSSSFESDDDCRKYGLTEKDLVANSKPRSSKPYFKDSQNQNNGQEVIQIEADNQETAGPVFTPPKNVYTENHRDQKNVRKFENSTRRMRSVSESDHSKHVSLPIIAFTKSTGQIDGRYLPENSKNYSNPNLSNSLESDVECRKYRFTKTNLVANHQPRPSEPLLKDFQNQNNGQEVIQIEEDNQGTAGSVSTPPKNVHAENHRAQKNVKKIENTTRRMRSVSESDHREPVSLPIVAFTKSTEQIDGRYLPENTKNHSNPNSSSSLESGDECRKYGFTKRDLVSNRQPRPRKLYLKDFENQNNSRDDEQIEEDNQGTVDSLLTPPATPSESIGQENFDSYNPSDEEEEESPDFSKYIMICIRVCWDLVQWKHLFSDTFSASDILMTLVSIGLFLFDVITDLQLAEAHYTKIEDNEIYRVYFVLTLSFVIIPLLITQIFSIHYEYAGIYSRKSKMMVLIFFHFFQLSVLYRYILVIYYGLKLRYYECVKNEVNQEYHKVEYKDEIAATIDSRLIESFMESAPQLVLQIYIVLMTKQFPLITVISCAGSLLALSTTMVTFQRFWRVLQYRTHLSIFANIVIFWWKTCTILSRVVVFGLFLTVQPYVFLVCIIVHWVVTTVWIVKVKTGNKTLNVLEMLFIGFMYGFVYIFCYIDTQADGDKMKIKPRIRMSIFYAVVVIEIFFFLIWWFLTQLHSHTGLPFGNLSSTSSNETFTVLPFGNLSSTSSNVTIVENELFPTESAGIFEKQHAFIILVAVNGLFLLGMFFMLVYYQVLHHSKSLPTCCKNLSCRKQWHNTSEFQTFSGTPGLFTRIYD